MTPGIEGQAGRTCESPADLEHQDDARAMLENLTGCAILNMPPCHPYDWQFIDRESGDCRGLGEYKCRSNIRIESTVVQDYGMWASVNKCAEMKSAAIELRQTETRSPGAGSEPVANPFYFWELYEGIYFAMAEFFDPEWITTGHNWNRKDRSGNQITEKMYVVPARHLVHARELKKELYRQG